MWPPGEITEVPDFESMVVNELKGSGYVLSFLGGDSTKIASELPPKNEDLFLQVGLDGGFERIAGWLFAARIRIEAWGGHRRDARDLCIAAHAFLSALRGTSSDGRGIVTGVTTLILPRKFVDPVNNRPRYQAELYITAHPDPADQLS